MLPVVSGIKTTKINIFIYAIILLAVTIIPYFFGYFGVIYFGASLILESIMFFFVINC